MPQKYLRYIIVQLLAILVAHRVTLVIALTFPQNFGKVAYLCDFWTCKPYLL